VEGRGGDAGDARRRGSFDATASAAAVVRAAKRAGVQDASSSAKVFAAAANGNPVAAEIVAEEALLVAKAACTVIAVADPELIVLGGGIGQAPGFIDLVVENLRTLAPVMPDVKVSVLGADSVVTGCIVAGLDQVWRQATAAIPAPTNSGQ
jgi:predicted NBD/HSP70 family sugar kinase